MLDELRRKKPTRERTQLLQQLESSRKTDYTSLIVNSQLGMEIEQQPEVATQALYADSSRKAYMAELNKVIESADILVQVLDSRDPLGYRSEDLENKVLSYGTKRMILVLNKIDLIPPPIANAWYNYLSQFHPVVLFKSNTQKQNTRLGAAKLYKSSLDSAKGEEILKSTKTVGGEALLNLIKNYMRSGDRKLAVTVGVVGYPNVGKSSLINSMRRSKAVGVSSQPGYTKTIQEVELESQIKILDSPGVVYSATTKDDPRMVLRNVKQIESLEDPVTPVEGILCTVAPETLMELYGIGPYADTTQFLIQIAMKRGKLKKGGAPNMDAAARVILQEWMTGKIPFYTVPPS